MKRALQFLAVLVILAFGTVALAAFAPTRILNLYVLNKLLVGNGTEANAITKVLTASSTINFTAAALGCADSSAITVTGAAVGDPCSVGVPATVGSTADAGVQSTFSCYVSAADAVKVRFCTFSYEDPASSTYYVRVISSQ